MAKTIAVFGATGLQGGGVVRAMLNNKQYVIRAITRNPDSEKGIRLKQQGKITAKVNFKLKLRSNIKVR